MTALLLLCVMAMVVLGAVLIDVLRLHARVLRGIHELDPEAPDD